MCWLFPGAWIYPLWGSYWPTHDIQYAMNKMCGYAYYGSMCLALVDWSQYFHEDMVRRVGHCGQFSVIWEHSTDHIFIIIVFHRLIRDTYYHSRHIHTIYSLCIVVYHESVSGGRTVTLAHNSIWKKLDHFRVEIECLVSSKRKHWSDVKHCKVLFH